MASSSRVNNLIEVLQEEGLSYVDIQHLCLPQAVVSARTVRDLARGRRRGSLRSWERIVEALNRRPVRGRRARKTYTLADLLGPEYEGL